GTYTLKGSGDDIFFSADGFHFAFTQLTGDGEIRARVTSQTNANPWGKAGVMFRESLTGGSRHATMFTTPTGAGNGFGAVWRPTANAATSYAGGPALNTAPNNWVRLVRAGNVFTAYASANGRTWTTLSATTLSGLGSTLYVGLAVTSSESLVLGTATFDNVQIVGTQALAAPAVVTVSGPSTGATSSSVADTDFDGDDVNDLLEYALGTQDSYGGGWWLTSLTGGRVDAHLVHPAVISDVTYTLETSSDLVNWQPLALSPTLTDLGGGYIQRSWSGITSLTGQSTRRGIVRLRVTHVKGSTAASAPQAWQQLTLPVGSQTVGVSLVNAPFYAGFVSSITGAAALKLYEAAGLVADPLTSYYLEVRDGAQAGHRYDISSIAGDVVTLALSSARNTQSVLPPDIAGARIFIRPHMTLGQVFAKELMTSGTLSTAADQVLFHNGKAWDTYWLNKTATRHIWVKSGDTKFTPRDSEIIAPGTGVMVKVLKSAKSITLTGYVRMNSFRRKLGIGSNFLALPRPLDATPNLLGFKATNGFTATTSVTTADQLQLWTADTTPRATTYTIYWLRNAGTSSFWVPQAGPVTQNVSDTLKLPAHRAFFLKAQTATAKRGWFLE
ncbi:MAG: hypothetical protein ABL974_14160, partial [Prosthecobacter sp.]